MRNSGPEPVEDINAKLTDRQRSEIEYHISFAEQQAKNLSPVDETLITSATRRWWNQGWSMWTELLALDLAGKKVLAIGCGSAADCVLLAKAGASVSGFDLSADMIRVGRIRAERAGVELDLQVMPSEQLSYADDQFDIVLAHDILHHVEIQVTMKEVARVSKPGARLVINEVYTHSGIDRLRHSWIVEKLLYRPMKRVVYGTDAPYITPDERKMNEGDMEKVREFIDVHSERYFDLAINRVLPPNAGFLNKVDTAVLNYSTWLGRRLAGRVLLVGSIRNAGSAEQRV
jgi:ubiquinone/menaquinone biosynthesis C-methylase UbiE